MSLRFVSSPHVITGIVCCALPAVAQEEARQNYSLPRGDAATTLRQFAGASGRQIIFMMDKVRGEQTNAIAGEFSPREALERMLAGTALVAVQDEATKAFVIKRSAKLPQSDSSEPTPQPKTAEDPSKPMNRKNIIAVIAGWLAITLAPVQPVHAADGNTARQTAVISGQVSNAATRTFLQGAIVTLAGANQTTTTDREGRYSFAGVEPGEVTLEVGFTGLDTQQVRVAIGAGQRVVRDVELTSEIYKLEKFTVAGQREGNAKAVTLQRQAPNVKSVVSSDTFGNVADGNIGDLLQRVVGITANYNGPDVRSISIRGVSGDLNSVTMDGQQIASAQSAGTGRQFEFEQASLGNIETIEVTKAPTPDMDGASIGGSVNLVSKSAFDRAGRTITYGLGFSTLPRYQGPSNRSDQLFNGVGPSFNFLYQDILGEKRNLGITLTGLLHSGQAGQAWNSNQFERKNEPGPVYNYSTAPAYIYGTGRTRMAGGLKLDYRWSDRTTVSFNASYNFFHETNNSRQLALSNIGVATAAVPNVLATVDAAGNRTGGGFINPNYTNTFTRLYANPSSRSAISHNANDKSGRTFLFSPSVKHRLDGLSIDYSLTYSNSATYYDVSQDNGKYKSRPKATVSYELFNIGWTVDRSKDSIIPTITQTEGPDFKNPANYSNLLLTQTDRRGFDTVFGGKFDIKKDLNLSLPTYIKAGFTVQKQKRKLWQDPRRYNYTGPDGIRGTADDNQDLAQFREEPHAATGDEEDLFTNRGGMPSWLDPHAIARHQKLYPELWKEDIAFTSGKLTSRLMLEERIAAAYVLGNVRLGKASLLTGLRFEDTRDEGEGPLNRITSAEAARRAAWVGPVTDAEQRRRNLEQFGSRFTNAGKYQFFLPGVHLKYEPVAHLVARLSWSTGVGRPQFGSIIPNTTVNDAARTVALSNPNLKPQYGRNWDLSAEYYFKPQGMISFGAFRKDITDYIATNNSRLVEAGQNNGFDGQYEGYRITTSINDGTAKIEGVEFSYQQQLTFLPGWAKGFGIYSSYTKLRTEGNNSAFVTGAAGKTLAGFLGATGNIGLGYQGLGLDLRLETVYRGNYLTSNNVIPALVQRQASKWTWNWKSRYNFRRGLGVFLDLENITQVPLDTLYSGYRDRVTFWGNYHTKIVGGISGRF